MALLQAGVDTTVIALWLGHADLRSNQPYLHVDLTIKERALALVTPTSVPPGRYKPPAPVLAFLEACDYADNPRARTVKKPAREQAVRGHGAHRVGIVAVSA